MNLTTREDPFLSWHGWLWTGQAWERVCYAPTLGECSSRLGEVAKRRGVPDKLSCMTGGGPPAFTPVGEKEATRHAS